MSSLQNVSTAAAFKVGYGRPDWEHFLTKTRISGFPETAPVSSKGGRREIPYLAGVAKFQARGPLFMRDSPVLRRPCGPPCQQSPRQTAPERDFGAICPALRPTRGHFAHVSSLEPSGLGNLISGGRAGILEKTGPLGDAAYSRAQRNITFSEHAANKTSINATCSRSPANLRIGLMMGG